MKLDLENFARLWICGVPSLPSSQGYYAELTCSAISGSPAINLFYAETNGGIGYLTDTNVAQNLVGEGMYGRVSPTSPQVLPPDFFDGSNQYFLFEGAGVGEGQFTLTIYQGSNIVAQASTHIDLHDIQDFYERAVITNDMSGAISNWSSSIESEQPAVANLLGNDTNLIVFVHGFNVGDWNWLDDSDTILKRLYWAGYDGKFASVKWPDEPLTLWTVLTENTSIFNDSEVKAYKASTSLTTYLNQLRTRFPGYRLNILAHSQGNAVVSEAIEQGAPFDTYIMTQAAMPASGYDVATPEDSDLLDAEAAYATPQLQPMGYQGVYTNMTGNIVNFYNPLDPVLDWWVTDQAGGKPDGYAKHQLELIPPLIPVSPYYSYDGTNGWYNTPVGSGTYQITDSQESRAMVSRSLTLPIGQSGPETAHGVIKSGIDLHANFNFSNASFADHSAEWAWPIQTTLSYYQQVLLQIRPTP
jgi:Alpha/beta hydrolase of unknown function (DUF900)